MPKKHLRKEVDNMWTVYLQYGYHNIVTVSDDDFEKIKKFYRLFKAKDDTYTNKRGDIHAWKKECAENALVKLDKKEK